MGHFYFSETPVHLKKNDEMQETYKLIINNSAFNTNDHKCKYASHHN